MSKQTEPTLKFRDPQESGEHIDGGDSEPYDPIEPAGIWMGSVVSQQPTSAVAETDPYGYEDDRLTSVDLGSESDLDQEETTASSEHFVVTPETKWDEVQQRAGPECSRPVVFNRAPTANTTNPFGATLFWNIQGFIFEVSVITCIVRLRWYRSCPTITSLPSLCFHYPKNNSIRFTISFRYGSVKSIRLHFSITALVFIDKTVMKWQKMEVITVFQE